MRMLGGLFIIWLHKPTKTPIPVESLVMERLSGAAMEFLIVTTIATHDQNMLCGKIPCAVVILVGGVTWTFICFFALAPQMLPDAKLERAVMELGRSFGTTVTGLPLRRICDPEKKTAA
eukprot:jgi/Tetstr1/425197/TSEL_015658.t1